MFYSRDICIAPRSERVLLIGYFDPRGISTVPEILDSIRRLSVFPVTCINLFDHRFDTGNLKLNPEIDLAGFDNRHRSELCRL